MPNYDYECRSCGHDFEIFQRMSDDFLTQCPSCGKEKLQRLIGGGLGIIFKGSGFYVNDVRRAEVSSTDGSKDAKQTPEKSDLAKTSQISNSSTPEKATA